MSFSYRPIEEDDIQILESSGSIQASFRNDRTFCPSKPLLKQWPYWIGLAQIAVGFLCAIFGCLEVFVIPFVMDLESGWSLNQSNAFGVALWSGILCQHLVEDNSSPEVDLDIPRNISHVNLDPSMAKDPDLSGDMEIPLEGEDNSSPEVEDNSSLEVEDNRSPEVDLDIPRNISHVSLDPSMAKDPDLGGDMEIPLEGEDNSSPEVEDNSSLEVEDNSSPEVDLDIPRNISHVSLDPSMAKDPDLSGDMEIPLEVEDNSSPEVDLDIPRNRSHVSLNPSMAKDPDLSGDIEVSLEGEDNSSPEVDFNIPRNTKHISLEPRYHMGDYILINHGTSLLPAVVDEWPWVKFFTKSKRNSWTMNEMRHTILVTDIEKKIAPPDISMYGSRLVYTFEGESDFPAEKLCGILVRNRGNMLILAGSTAVRAAKFKQPLHVIQFYLQTVFAFICNFSMMIQLLWCFKHYKPSGDASTYSSISLVSGVWCLLGCLLLNLTSARYFIPVLFGEVKLGQRIGRCFLPYYFRDVPSAASSRQSVNSTESNLIV